MQAMIGSTKSRERHSPKAGNTGFGEAAQERLLADLRAIRERVARSPELDNRTDEEIVGYDEHGIPN